MQTIYLDISNKGVIPTIYAKQGDVGRKFEVVLTDAGLPYVPAGGSAFSVWYSGASGEGNYTDIGDKSAFSVNGNKVTVEMITQMLLNDGDGIMSLVVNGADGSQIASWNINYLVEPVPGANSEEAKSYYTAFSKAIENLPYPDASLSVIGKAADAAATGAALAGKAPAGYGLGSELGKACSDCDLALENGYYQIGASTAHRPDGMSTRRWMQVISYGSTYKTQICYSSSNAMQIREMNNGTWGEWEWVNPPTIPGVEYRTTERWNGKVVYTKLVNCGTVINDATVTLEGVTACVRFIGYLSYPNETNPRKQLPIWSGSTIGTGYHAEITQPASRYDINQFIIKTDSLADSFGSGSYNWYVHAWYTKD